MKAGKPKLRPEWEETRHPYIERRDPSIWKLPFRVRRYMNGRELCRVLKARTFEAAKEEAEKEIAEFFGEAHSVKKTRERTLIGDEMPKFLDIMALSWDEKTTKKNRRIWNKHLKDHFSSKLPEDVPRLWPDYIAKKAAEKKGMTFFNIRKLLLNLCNYLADQGRPLPKMKLINPDPEHETGVEYTDEEIKKMMEHAPDRYRAMIFISLKTGMRDEEIRTMEKRFFSPKRKEYFLDKEHAKGGRPRTVLLDDSVVALLKRLVGEAKGDLLFPTRTGKVVTQAHRHLAWKVILRNAGLPESYHFHWIKHTAVTRMIRKGVALQFVSKQVGTSVQELMDTYSHIIPDDARIVATAVEVEGEGSFFKDATEN